jgi:hypothetical protein
MNVVTFLPPAKATHLGGSRVSRPVRRRHRSKRQTRHDQVIVAIRLAVLMAIRQVLSEAPFLSGAP